MSNVDLGPMPVWNLADLYPGPQSKDVASDLKKAAAEAKRFKETYEGKLAALARQGAPFGEAIAAYERLLELQGRLASYAGLLYTTDQANPEHARFYGNVQEQLTDTACFHQAIYGQTSATCEARGFTAAIAQSLQNAPRDTKQTLLGQVESAVTSSVTAAMTFELAKRQGGN